MSCGEPKCSSTWRATWASVRASSSVRQGLPRKPAGMAGPRYPVALGTKECSRSLVPTLRPVISPVTLLTVKLSGVTSPATRAEPSPQVPSMATTERSPVTGLRVNMTPAARVLSMRWMTTAIARPCSGSPIRRR